MSPSETVSLHSTAQQSVPVSLVQKKSSRSIVSKEKPGVPLIRTSSPFTPWEDNEPTSKKRKSLLKGANRSTKAVKNNGKESKKKNKNEKLAELKTRSQDISKSKKGKKFSHHHDINTYIKEYRQEKLSELKDENSSVESYGLAEITKAYEDLGISKCNNTSRLSNFDQKGFLPPVKDSEKLETKNPEGKENTFNDNPLVDDSYDEESESEMASPEAMEKRNNLNLSPLRKQVRLPDVSNYPVQTVSGINLLELAKLATARAESTDLQNKSGMRILSYKPKSTMTERKMLPTSLNLQEKVMCRVVDLSLPKSHQITLKKANIVLTNETEEKCSETDKTDKVPKMNRDCNENEEKETTSSSSDDSRNDLLILAINSSRSSQSSVLSQACSSLSSGSVSTRSPTVKEMLTAAVKNLHPFDKLEGDSENGRKNVSKNELLSESPPQPKQFISLHPYRKPVTKQSLKKFIKLSTKNWALTKEKESSKKEENSLLLPPTKNSPSLPSLVIENSFKETNLLQFSSQDESFKLKRRARQRQEAAEKYEEFKRALTLNSKPKEGSKLAIISKCQTVVKPRVTVKGVIV